MTPPIARRPHPRAVAAVCTVALLGELVIACSPDDDMPAVVSVELRSSTDEPANTESPGGAVPRLTLTVHNDSDTACSVPKQGIGSAIVTTVTRDGTDVVSTSRPIPTFAPSIDAVRAALATLPPGESLALDVQTASDPAVVESHRIETDGTLMRTSWPVDEQGEYRITAALATPPAAARDGLPPLCTPADPSTTTFTVR